MILYGESFSPWTKKARWALEHCGLVYTYREYTPTLSEPALRLKLRQWSGSVSVPILFAGRNVLRDSWEIAQFANDTSSDQSLGDFAAIAMWNRLSETALAEGRTRVVRRVLASDVALEESLPPFIPSAWRPRLRFIARDAVSRLDRKYAALVQPGSLRLALEQVRETLEKSGGEYLLGRFSYADITMAVVIELVAPIAIAEPPIGPAVQPCWCDSALAEEFADVVVWRDRLAANPATSYSQFVG
ncbi:MAG: glutathione S-transferase N-terminal domain-containing protein [Pseudomonadota bacterium]